MKYLLSWLLIVITYNAFGQSGSSIAGDGYAVVKGHINNTKNSYWEYIASEYIGYKRVAVPIDKNGDFSAKIKLQGTYTDVFLQLGQGLFIYLQKNDTISINWDTKNSTDSLRLKTPKAGLERDLKTNIGISELYISSIQGLHEVLYQEQLTDSVKFAKVNELYNKVINRIAAGHCTSEAQFKMATDIYFRCASLLLDHHLLKKHELFIEHPSPGLGGTTYRIESEVYFKSSSDYRNFIYDYVRLDIPFAAWGPSNDSNRIISNIALNTCYSGLMAFHMYEIRDWYLARVMISNFESVSFKDASEAYSRFLPQIKTSYYTDTLKKFYAGIKSLKPGTLAPNFTLKNENGTLISLNMFKGKVVYINFWGTKCGPCIEEIKNEVPALYTKYKDKNIVFINICIDASDAEWKTNLSKLNMRGVNLIAKGWTKNPVCKDYNISSIPHHCLIDKAGKIITANSPGPSQSYLLHQKLDLSLK